MRLPQAKAEPAREEQERKLLCAGFAVSIVFGCFYIFPSGVPQPAHFYTAGLFLIAARGGALSGRHYAPILTPLVLTVAYFTIVGYVHYIRGRDLFTIISPLYYIYNAGVLLLAASLCHLSPSKMRAYVSTAVVIVLAVQVLAVYSGPSYPVERQTGTFNDPNQLGYMIILAVYIKLICKGRDRLNYVDAVCFMLAIIIILRTQSRSAAIGFSAMLLCALFVVKATFLLKATALCAALAAFLGSSNPLNSVTSSDLVMGLIHRFGERGHDDTFAGRGYGRLLEHPQYLLLGAGEGQWWRYNERNEIHSTWANILFSYGAIGFGLFLWLLYRVFCRVRLGATLMFVGPAAYGFSTYGARFSIFWLALGIAYGLAEGERKEHAVSRDRFRSPGTRPLRVPSTRPRSDRT